MKKTFDVEGVPPKAGPYSHAVIANGSVYVCGQGPFVPETNELAGTTIKEHTHQTLENIKTILEAVGSSLEDVVKVNVYLENLDDFGEFNEVYGEFFKENQPVRTTVGANLLGQILIEIDCIAAEK